MVDLISEDSESQAVLWNVQCCCLEPAAVWLQLLIISFMLIPSIPVDKTNKGRWSELYSPHISRSLAVLSLRRALRSSFPSYKSPRLHLCPPKNINIKSPVTSPFGLFPDQYLSEALQHQISRYTSGFTFPLWFWLPGNSLFWAWVLHLTDWFQIGKGVRQGCILSPCLFNLNAE